MMKSTVAAIFLLPAIAIANSSLQQLMPDGTLSFDVPNDQILSMIENIEMDLPGVKKMSYGEGAKKVTVEKYDRGNGHYIEIKVGGWRTIYSCHVTYTYEGKVRRYCY